MDMAVDKSEDELELERLVFGDADGIKHRLKEGNDIEHAIQKTDLEHLENEQARRLCLLLELILAIFH
jgi:hypothetical protein